MSEEIRKQINSIKNWENQLKENFEGSLVLNDEYFKKRVPFFKYFENNSNGDQVQFNHYKSWQDKAVLQLGQGKGFVKFSFFSVETKFNYYKIESRDFESEEKLSEFHPMFKNIHNFIYSTEINTKLPEATEMDEVPNQIVALMLKEIIKDELKFREQIEVKEEESFPKEKLDKIFNDINKNILKIEEILQKMKLSYF